MSDATAPAATDRQIAYLRDLAKTYALFGRDVGHDETVAKVEAEINEGLSFARASELITAGQRGYPHKPQDRPAQDFQIRSLRALAEEKAIYGLGVTKEETMARVQAAIASGLTFQAASELRVLAYNAKPHPTAKSPLPLKLVEGIDNIEVSEGHYAVLVEGVLRFYRVYTPATGELKDEPVMRRFASENLLALYPNEARTALHLIDADPDTAAYRFADEFTRCFTCGRQLTDAVSRLLSVGPHCRGFSNHTGLRREATEVDKDPARRRVYRAIRQWALDQGFRDPRDKNERVAMQGQMTASWIASAWSGLPGLLALPADDAVKAIKDAIGGEVAEPIRRGLLAAPADTVLVLIESGVLSAAVLTLLAEHPSKKVRESASEFFLSLLGG